MNLFDVPDDYCLVQCISADFGMGKGIAVQFNRKYHMRRVLLNKYPDYLDTYRNISTGGDCILEGRVLNLVTKERYFQKPSYYTMAAALLKMKEVCMKNVITKIAMPRIGCGIDRLIWEDVRHQVEKIFGDTDAEILFCYLK